MATQLLLVRLAVLFLLCSTSLASVANVMPVPIGTRTNRNTSRHSIIFILTDDQDMALGGLTPMTNLKELVIDQGTLFTNAFVSTPICCPSRSSILTGKYVHNHGARNNSLQGNCAGADWVANNEKATIATALQQLGYKTMFAGKYLNQYGVEGSPSPVSHVPPGWDSWLGLCGNSK